MSYSAQNSITVRRLRNGDTLFITIENNGVALYQSVDTATGLVSPSWGTGTSQVHPVLTPKVTSARGNTVTLSGHTWSYNGTALSFNGSAVTVDGVSYTLSTTDSRFGMSSAGALVILGDLASKSNPASDNLTYSCTATCASVSYTLTKSVDIQIQNGGASAYYGTILADTQQLSATVTSATLKTALYQGGTRVTSYYVKWEKDSEEWTAKAGQASPTVTISDVDGTQLFIANFYLSSTDTTPVFVAAIRITDTNDDYHVGHRYVNADGTTTGTPNREVSTSSPVYVQSYIINVRTNQEITSPSSASWTSYIMDKDTWDALSTIAGSGATNLVTITTAHTDVDGAQKDVEVVSEVTFEL